MEKRDGEKYNRNNGEKKKGREGGEREWQMRIRSNVGKERKENKI